MPDETIKLFEAPLLSQYFTGYNRVLQEQDYNAALSPQELDALRSDYLYRTLNPGLRVHQPVNEQMTSGIQGVLDKNKLTNDQVRKTHIDGFRDNRVKYVHTEKDEVFALGITSLCAACNNPLTDFYDIKTLTLNGDKINQKLAFMRELGYSPQLIQLITGMLALDPAGRPTLANILSVVNQPYSVVGNNGQIIGQAVPGPITNSTFPGQPGFGGNAPVMPGQPVPQAPLNPGMAAFQQGVPQRTPNTGAPVPLPAGPSTFGQPQAPLNPGMSAFQQPAQYRPSGTNMPQTYPGQPTAFGTVSPSVPQRIVPGGQIRSY